MKSFNTLLVLLIVSMSLFWGCRGEDGLPGPQGPPGYDGEDGGIVLALMYEFEFDLNQATDWQATYSFPQADLENIYPDDVVLVYYLWEVVNGKDVWRLMPVTYFYPEGVQMINYDFTLDDVRIFVESQFDLDPQVDFYNGVVARIVIVPAEKSINGRKATVDYSDYEAVKAAYKLKEGNNSLKGTPFKEILRIRGAEIK